MAIPSSGATPKVWGPELLTDGIPQPDEAGSDADVPGSGVSGYQTSPPPDGVAPPASDASRQPALWRTPGVPPGAASDVIGIIHEVVDEADREPNPIDRIGAEAERQWKKFGLLSKEGGIYHLIANSWWFMMSPIYSSLTSQNPLHLLAGLMDLLGDREPGDHRDYLRGLYRETLSAIPKGWALILDPVREIAGSDTSRIFLKIKALEVLAETDQETASRLLLEILRKQDNLPALREAALALWGRIDKVPDEVEEILFATVNDEKEERTMRQAAIEGLMRPSNLDTLIQLAVVFEEDKIRWAILGGLRRFLSRFGNEKPAEFDAAFERFIHYVRGRDRGDRSGPNLYQPETLIRVSMLSVGWGESGVRLVAELSEDIRPIMSPMVVFKPLQHDRKLAFAVAHLLHYPKLGVRRYVAEEILPQWGLNGALAAIGSLDSEFGEAREVAEKLVRDVPPFQRVELAERLVEELRDGTEYAGFQSRPDREMARLRPSPAQIQLALERIGPDAWEVVQKAYSYADDEAHRKPYLKAALDKIAAKAFPEMRTAFTGPYPEMRKRATSEFARMGSYSIPVLLEYFIGDDPALAERAMEALEGMGEAGFKVIHELMSKGGLTPEVIERCGRFEERAGAELVRAWSAEARGSRGADRRSESPFDLSLEGLRRGR